MAEGLRHRVGDRVTHSVEDGNARAARRPPDVPCSDLRRLVRVFSVCSPTARCALLEFPAPRSSLLHVQPDVLDWSLRLDIM